MKFIFPSANKYQYRDFFNTATHEIGHSLGLDHSGRKDSIMNPFYDPKKDESGNYLEPDLSKYDIERIQDIYGKLELKWLKNKARITFRQKNEKLTQDLV